MYIYQSHEGGYYTSDEVLDYKDLYCEICGDCDYFIGYADSREEAWNLLRYEASINDCGGYDYDMIKSFIETWWDDDTSVDDLKQQYIESGDWARDHIDGWGEEED